MRYNPEKVLVRNEKVQNSEEFRDLLYDLESFVIDSCYPINSGSTQSEAESLERIGKKHLHEMLVDEYERAFAASKLRPILVSLEIPESIKGFRILEIIVLECAKRLWQGKGIVLSEIYPTVAQCFGINAHNCERLCRYACSFARPTVRFVSKYPKLETLTHRTFESVTVKEIAGLLAEYLVNDCGYKPKSVYDC